MMKSDADPGNAGFCKLVGVLCTGAQSSSSARFKPEGRAPTRQEWRTPGRRVGDRRSAKKPNLQRADSEIGAPSLYPEQFHLEHQRRIRRDRAGITAGAV